MNSMKLDFHIILIYVSLLLMVIFWGFSFVIVHIAVEYIPPLSIALYRLTIASFSFLLIDICRKFKRNSDIENLTRNPEINNGFTKEIWILIVLASFTGVSLYLFMLYSAVEIIGPSLPALFDCLVAPVIIAIFSLIFFRENLNILKIIGFILASIGSYFLITGGDINTFTPGSSSFLGYLFILTTPFLWATYSTIIKKIKKSYEYISDFQALKFITYLGCLELFFLVLISNQLEIFIINFFNILLLLCGIYLGLICFVFGYYVWNYSQKKLKSSKVASFLYIEPFFTLIFSILLQRSEKIVLWNIVGAIIVFTAVLLINYK
ncbi:MAG: DMT family transporter [Promethearchaeota archaeon]|nr:MAG: DMT family transporter [Candidatus Lokiarchaeota archaeon]